MTRQRIFRAVKLLCVTLQWWMHVILLLSKAIECKAYKVVDVKHGLSLVSILVCQL